MDTQDLLDGSAELHDVLALALNRCGQVALSEVAIDPRGATYFETLGDGAKAAARTAADAAAAVRRAHAPKIDRILAGDAKEKSGTFRSTTGAGTPAVGTASDDAPDAVNTFARVDVRGRHPGPSGTHPGTVPGTNDHPGRAVGHGPRHGTITRVRSPAWRAARRTRSARTG